MLARKDSIEDLRADPNIQHFIKVIEDVPENYEFQSRDDSDSTNFSNWWLLHNPYDDSSPKGVLMNIDSGLVADNKTNCHHAKQLCHKLLSSVNDAELQLCFRPMKKESFKNITLPFPLFDEVSMRKNEKSAEDDADTLIFENDGRSVAVMGTDYDLLAILIARGIPNTSLFFLWPQTAKNEGKFYCITKIQEALGPMVSFLFLHLATGCDTIQFQQFMERPQPPRKILSKQASHPKIKLCPESTDKSENNANDLSKEMYDALVVDRNNKDATIHELEAHINELTSKVKVLEEEIQTLKECHESVVSKLKEDLKNVNSKNKECLLEIEKQTCSMFTMEGKLCSAENAFIDNKECTESSISEKINQVIIYQHENGELKTQIEALQETVRSLNECKEDVNVLRSVNQALTEDFLKLKEFSEENKVANEKEIVELTRVKVELETKLGTKQELILMLQGELSTAELELEECRSETEKLLLENAKGKHTYDKEMEEMRFLLSELERRIADDREEQASLRARLEEKLEITLNLKSGLQEHLDTALKERSGLEEKLKSLQQELKQAEELHIQEVQSFIRDHGDKMGEVHTKLESKEKYLKSLIDKVAHIEKALTEKTCLCEDLRISNMEQKITIVELQDTIDALSLELNVVKDNLEKLEVKLKLKERECKKLEISMNTTHASLEALKERLLENESDFVNMAHENSELKADKQKHEEELNLLLQQLECEKENLNKLEVENLKEIENIHSELLGKLKDFEQKAAEKEKAMQMADLEKQHLIDSLSLDLEDFRKKLEEIKEYVAELEGTNNEQSQELARKEEFISTLTCQLESQSIDLKNSQEQVQQKEADILHYKQYTNQLLSEIESINMKSVELQDSLTIMEESVADRDRDIAALTEKLDHQRDCAQVANQQITSLEASQAFYELQVQELSSELAYHKEYSVKLAEHITLLEKENIISNFSMQLNELHCTKQKLENELNTVVLDKSKKENDLINMREQVSNLESETKNQLDFIDKLSTQINKLESKAVEVSNQLCMVESEKSSKEQELVEMSERLSKLQLEMIENEEMISQLSTQIDGLKIIEVNLRNQVSATENAKADKEEQLITMSARIVKLETAKKDLELELRELIISSELKENNKAKSLSSFLKSTEDLKKTIHESVDELVAIEKTVSNQNNFILELKSKIKMKDEIIMERESKLKKVKDSVETLNKEIGLVKCVAIEKEKELLENLKAERCKIESLKLDLIALRKILAEKTEELARKTRDSTEARLKLEGMKALEETIEQMKQQTALDKLTIEGLKRELGEKEEQLVSLSSEVEAKCSVNWEQRCKELESLIGPFRQQLEAFELERHMLETRKMAAEHEVKDLATKYAELLGHQNHKQKIKHMVKLKEHNLELKAEVEKLENHNLAQKRTINKLKEELAAVTKSKKGQVAMVPSRLKGKENVEVSPSKMRTHGSSTVSDKPSREFGIDRND
ncbi:unnamed protein product [Timema podura]|uniref:Hyaluronan-mediated motility receptor C-terminal domain-containing protein n=1 Tax=Timema podura TaxID=61482 RepID=A0ABN7NR97_TIMPD|nr:unnamed protein product [Timema podura]